MSKQLIIFPRGALSPKDKERMSKEGFLAIETDDPSKVIALLPSGNVLTGDMLLASAFSAIRKSGSTTPGYNAWTYLSNLVTAALDRKAEEERLKREKGAV